MNTRRAPHRKLLILDLDETLFYATEHSLLRPESFRVEPYRVYLRPQLEAFLSFCAARFDLAVWTSSSPDYAEAMVREVFGESHALVFVWARDRCTPRVDARSHDAYWVKNLKKVKKMGYRLAEVLVVDDTPRKHESNYGNLIQVRGFGGDADDSELLHVMPVLERLATVADVRTIEKRWWRRGERPDDDF
jgi:TFIIF-interacting CTD phosphatase-like protein